MPPGYAPGQTDLMHLGKEVGAMSRETTADLEGPEEGTCCEFFGAAYEAPQPAVRSRAAARARPPSLIAAEPDRILAILETPDTGTTVDPAESSTELSG